MHKAAIPAAKAATAAHLQGKFWEFHDALFAAPKLDDDEYKKIASGLGINLSRWEQDRASLPVDKAVQADMQKMGKMGITSTPMFFVNGYRVKGAQPPDAFARIIDAELADGG
jgi:protein-disulfide isomerase